MSLAAARGAALLLVVTVIFGTGFVFGKAFEGQRFAEYREARQTVLNAAQREARETEHLHQRAVAQLDAQHTKELHDAQAEIDRLRDDVGARRRRLSVSAECVPEAPEAGAAAGLDDAAGPRLTDAAERDYWRLRERIETVIGQLTACQAYVREVTQAKPGGVE